MHRKPIALSWSGGKDSALALHALLRDRTVDVAALVTTVTSEYDRVSMHGVRTALLEEQATVLGLPLHVVRIPPGATNAQYERAMRGALQTLRERGMAAMAFGDLFLADVREYRESAMPRGHRIPARCVRSRSRFSAHPARRPARSCHLRSSTRDRCGMIRTCRESAARSGAP